MEQPDDTEFRHPAGAPDDPSPHVLTARNVRVVHRGRGRTAVTAVDDVSLRITRGQIVGIVGESGSGKTSLAMVLAGLQPASTGQITVLGSDLARASRRTRRALRPQVQVIFQDPHGSLDPRQSVEAGFAELRHLHPTRVGWITDADLLERVGLNPDVLRRFPHQLSGGQAQRICIARALLLRPALLIADEPTSGLDVSVQAQILDLLVDVRAEEGVSILLVSHDLALVRRVCDVVHVMYQGRVVERGVPEVVMESPKDEYTASLLAAIPGAEFRSRAVGVPDAGSVP